jgi:hypothetical protein
MDISREFTDIIVKHTDISLTIEIILQNKGSFVVRYGYMIKSYGYIEGIYGYNRKTYGYIAHNRNNSSE